MTAHFAKATLVAGAPRSGKTERAFEAFVEYTQDNPEKLAVMSVSNRLIADTLSDRYVRRTGVAGLARPVTTLNALAFRLITAMRTREQLPLPRLVNGAEQDALLRRVLASHVQEVERGEMCETCRLLRDYFATDNWSSIITEDSGLVADNDAQVPAGNTVPETGVDADTAQTSATNTTLNLLENGISTAFTRQLRDMLARLDEAGVQKEQQDELLAAVGNGDLSAQRLAIQWRLAFALREEYRELLAATYQDEFRLDSSMLLVEGQEAIRYLLEEDPQKLPAFLAVDDYQDLTLAGFAFLEALQQAGCELFLVGNPDESVQTFRGSYPDYLFSEARERLHATVESLPYQGTPSSQEQDTRTSTDDSDGALPTYLETLLSRVSLSITSEDDSEQALPHRPGKMPVFPDAYPIRPMQGWGAEDFNTAMAASREQVQNSSATDQGDPRPEDGSTIAAAYRSPREELDSVVWQIKQCAVQGMRTRNGYYNKLQWNDLAVIMHDNAQIRQLGDRLRADGVPVRYSSVTKLLSEEPFVEGLFALIELAQLRKESLENVSMNPGQLCAYVHSRIQRIASSPLVARNTQKGEEIPLRMETVETAMRTLAALPQIFEATEHKDEGNGEALPQSQLRTLMQQWQELRTTLEQHDADRRQASASSGIVVSNELMESEEERQPPEFGVDAMNLLLVQGQGEQVLQALASMLGRANAGQMSSYNKLWKMVQTLAEQLGSLRDQEPQTVLWEAWNTANVAHAWQKSALHNTDTGRLANDRLDVAMRLFAYAEGATNNTDINGFIAQVRQLQIEADSLAKVAPVDQAVTLTTPAGAAGGHWKVVWMPGLQEGTWPNLAARNTLFGGEDLVDLMLHGSLDATRNQSFGGVDARTKDVLSTEQKSFLFALSRTDMQLRVSAVRNEDNIPSDFLYTYFPELFHREDGNIPELPAYAQAEEGSLTLDMDLRGLVTLARMTLADSNASESAREDAVETLAMLANAGVESADPANWPFVNAGAASHAFPQTAGNGEPSLEKPHASSSLASANHSELPPRGAAPSQAKPSVRESQSSQKDRRVSQTVTLSPSQVDALWECPVCWIMQNRFAGPRPSSVATEFGSIIHDVAQVATEHDWDKPNLPALEELGENERIEWVTAHMMEEYGKRTMVVEQIADPKERFNAIDRDRKAEAALHAIATYFVRSNTFDYSDTSDKKARVIGSTAKFDVGLLRDSQAEQEFRSRFSLADITRAYNAIPGTVPLTVPGMRAFLGALVGGWPETMHDDLTIRLVGRIDRLEVRSSSKGEVIRLIDYKTGKPRTTKDQFSDLQLVCYQLGLAFPEETAEAGVGREEHTLPIAQSELFYMMHHDYPAFGQGAAETYFQEPLFNGDAINAQMFVPRMRTTKVGAVFEQDFPKERPEEIGEEAWESLKVNCVGADAPGSMTLWALTMIARVFYAAAASVADSLDAVAQEHHTQYCKGNGICPVCDDSLSMVYSECGVPHIKGPATAAKAENEGMKEEQA